MSKELKPCPFCGSEAEYHDGAVKDACLCGNDMCLLFARVLDIKLWNTRPIEDNLKAENKRLRKRKGIACLKHDLTGNIACGICFKKLQAENEKLKRENGDQDQLKMCQRFGWDKPCPELCGEMCNYWLTEICLRDNKQ